MSLDKSPIATACPRCDSVLQAGAYQDQSVQHCPSCAGTLFAQAALGKAIEFLSAEFFSKICPDTVLPELPAPDGLLECPLCLRQMERYGYMGSRKVMLDGCSHCNVVWVDALELAAMAKLLVQTDARVARVQKASHSADIVGTTMATRAVEAALLSGFISSHFLF